jgi:hypothetical protein
MQHKSKNTKKYYNTNQKKYKKILQKNIHEDKMKKLITVKLRARQQEKRRIWLTL